MSCYDPALRPNVVYVTGSTNLLPFLKAVAPILAQGTPAYTIVWQVSSSCAGVNAAFNPDSTKRLIKEGPGKLTVYYDATGVEVPCLLEPAGAPVDVGESDIFANSCAEKLGFNPADPAVGEYFGPIQAITLTVPATSSQKNISAEAAHNIFGRGGSPPWTDPNQLFIRSDSTGTTHLVSRAIDVPPAQWWGIDKKSASNMADQLQAVPQALAERTIGTISADFADKRRGNLTALAFQATGQGCGFWPDSTPFARDKQNVRDGHYPIWGPLHFFTRLESGQPSAAAGAFVLRYSVAKLDDALVKAVADSGTVPACAMLVSRDTEMGPLRPFRPARQCGCYFDSLTKGNTTCATCTTGNECPASAPACNYGYCEVQ